MTVVKEKLQATLNNKKQLSGSVTIGKPLAVIEVEEIDGGHKITVTDPSGSQELEIMNGEPGEQGPQGEKGETGEQGPQGETGAQGEKGEKGEKGETGEQGPAGKTPVKGVDYWTEADKAEIKKYIDENGGSGGAGPVIIDVVELPTENINENAFYRLLTGSVIANRDVYSTYNCYCVETLPETGEPATNLDNTEGNVYYNLSDEELYGYVDDMLSMGLGVPSGWYPIAALLGALGYEYAGVITDISEDPDDGKFRFLLKRAVYTYGYNWTSLEPIGRLGTGINAEIFNSLLNIASGDYSHAEGSNTIASGDFSHAEGKITEASGIGSHAEGVSNDASGNASHAEGEGTIASGDRSHAEGWCTTASGDNSHAEGYNTTASGVRSHAEGESSNAEGESSHAEGRKTTASGFDSHAEGAWTIASGDTSHAEGYETKAIGHGSHAEGWKTTASGLHSHAEGYDTTASGEYSHAEGSGTIASGNNKHVQGRYNIKDADNKYAHIVGNGTVTKPSNAHTLDWDGNAEFQGDVIAYGCDSGKEPISLRALSEKVNSGNSSSGSSAAIIDVVELPTENINENAFYRLVTGSLVFNQFVQNMYNCYCVETLPETGLPATNLDQTEGNVYYNLSDGELYGYVDDTLSMGLGVPSGWYPVATLLGALGYEYAGVITDIMDDPLDYKFRFLLKYVTYTPKDGKWTSYEIVGKAGSGMSSEVFNHPSNTASGIASHAEGYGTTASGDHSHAEGYHTTASGDRSHAEGGYTTASGYTSHAEGWNTTASGDYQHVQGKYNIDDNNSKYAHIVGNGEDGINRSNAHTLDWNGNAWFAGKIKVGGTGQDDPNSVEIATVDYVNSLFAEYATEVASLIGGIEE